MLSIHLCYPFNRILYERNIDYTLYYTILTRIFQGFIILFIFFNIIYFIIIFINGIYYMICNDKVIVYTEKHNSVYPVDNSMNHTGYYEYLLTPNTTYIHTILSPKNQCNSLSYNNETNILLFIKSTIDQFELRQSLRNTWANYKCYIKYGIRAYIYFTLGRQNISAWNTSSLIQSRIFYEHKIYQDILQFDFIESYYNVTRKLIGTIEYATLHCFNAKFILLIDQDFIVNPMNLAKYLSNINTIEYTRYVGGYIIQHAVPFRNENSKWFISNRNFPFNSYPSYPIGGTIIFSRPVVITLNKILRHMKLFPFDDVLIGIILEKLQIPIVHIKNIFFEKYISNVRQQFITLHTYDNANILFNIWKSLRFYDMCI
ncbi:unnamed protein product [Heterobilharzia americana]|nr:unnamed protein product [Heterobilharzia americana]